MEKLQAEPIPKKSDVKRKIFQHEDGPSRNTPLPKRVKLENKHMPSSDDNNDVSDNISFASSRLTESFEDEIVNFNQLDDVIRRKYIKITK